MHRPASVVEKTPEKELNQNTRDKVINPGQAPPVKPTKQPSYTTVAANRPIQAPSQPWTKTKIEKSELIKVKLSQKSTNADEEC